MDFPSSVCSQERTTNSNCSGKSCKHNIFHLKVAIHELCHQGLLSKHESAGAGQIQKATNCISRNSRARELFQIEEVNETRCLTYAELVNNILKAANFLSHHKYRENS